MPHGCSLDALLFSEQIAKDRASYLLDLAVVSPEEYSWESVREPLAELYTKAGMGSIAAFVKGP